MRKMFLMLPLLIAAVSVSAAGPRKPGVFNKEHLNVSAHGRYQYMINEHGIHEDMLESYTSVMAGVQVGLDTHPSDSNWWANAYNYPSLSLGFSFDNTSAMKTKPGTSLGDFYNLYLAMEFDFFRAGAFSLGPVIEVGATFGTDKYHPETNPMNMFIGSTLLANIAAGLEARVRFLPRWEFAVTGNLVHHSNGMVKVPNLGTNQKALGAKLKYYMAPQKVEKRIKLEKPDFPKGFGCNIYASYGVHSCDQELIAVGPEGYPVKARTRALVGVEGAWRYHRLLSTGIGVEGNYAENAYRSVDRKRRNMEAQEGYSPFYASVHLTQHLHYDNLSLHFALGVYAFKKTGIEEDMGRCFQRIGARYHFPSFKVGQMFIGVDMRAHYLDRSYCIEYSTGITF